MRKIIIKLFIKNHENHEDTAVRLAYGRLSGIVGIASNFLLMAVKIVTGFIIGSLAIVADGVNNLPTSRRQSSRSSVSLPAFPPTRSIPTVTSGSST